MKRLLLILLSLLLLTACAGQHRIPDINVVSDQDYANEPAGDLPEIKTEAERDAELEELLDKAAGAAAVKFRAFYGLTGGAAGDLDSYDGDLLNDGDIAIIAVADNKTYYYVLDATSGATENSPFVIAPDTNAGDKRWIWLEESVPDVEHFGGLEAAVSAIGSTPMTVSVTTDQTITGALSIPSTLNLYIPHKISISAASAQTITVEGIIIAPRVQFVGSNVTLSFHADAIEHIVLPEWWGENTTPGTTDMATEIQAALTSLTNSGGTVSFAETTYRVNTALSFPIVSSAITDITIQGAGSGLAAGGTAEPYGTRFDSYIAGGILFDLYTDSPECKNVQFRDFEAYDREGTSTNYGIRVVNFKTGCIVENVGFKNFYTAIEVTGFCHYAKFDNVASRYARGGSGISLEGANGVLLSRISSSQGAGAATIGLYLKASSTHLRGVTVTGSYFESNAGRGILVESTNNYKAYGINIIGNYFEHNGSTDGNPAIHIIGASGYETLGGLIAGNHIESDDDHISLTLVYVENMSVIGNHFDSYYNNRTVYSSTASGCIFAANHHNISASVGLDVPIDNIVFDTQNNLGIRIYDQWVGDNIVTLADDATPSVAGGQKFVTGGTTTITDFDDGYEGKEIKIISEHAITITDGTNIFLSGSSNWTMGVSDTLTLIQKADTFWYEQGRSDN